MKKRGIKYQHPVAIDFASTQIIFESRLDINDCDIRCDYYIIQNPKLIHTIPLFVFQCIRHRARIEFGLAYNGDTFLSNMKNIRLNHHAAQELIDIIDRYVGEIIDE